jgi:hypothetical protein
MYNIYSKPTYLQTFGLILLICIIFSNIQLPERIVVYELYSGDSADMHYRSELNFQSIFRSEHF